MDDWFAEPKKPETLHDKYTRRLVAWGWVDCRGFPSWETRTTTAYALLKDVYIDAMKDMLNDPIMLGFGYGRDWTRNPEGPP